MWNNADWLKFEDSWKISACVDSHTVSFGIS